MLEKEYDVQASTRLEVGALACWWIGYLSRALDTFYCSRS